MRFIKPRSVPAHRDPLLDCWLEYKTLFNTGFEPHGDTFFMTNDSFNKAWSAVVNAFRVNISTTYKVGASDTKVNASDVKVNEGSESYVHQSSE